MDERINNLVSFALNNFSEMLDVYDYYRPLADYCIYHPDEPITDDFNYVVGKSGGVKLVFLKLIVKLAERDYNKTKDNKFLKRMETFEGYYQNGLNRLAASNFVGINK